MRSGGIYCVIPRQYLRIHTFYHSRLQILLFGQELRVNLLNFWINNPLTNLEFELKPYTVSLKSMQ